MAEFFAESNIGDADVVQLLLDAYERGVEQGEGWGILRNVSMLPQTEATLRRLQKIDASDYNTIAHIDKAIVESDLELLRKFPGIRPKLPQNISILDNRFRLAAMKTEKLWEELWHHSESGMGHNLEEFDYEYGGLIVKELSARQDFPVDKYLERIQMVYPEDYSGWDETYLCALSGELRSEESLPFLIRTVKIDGDFVPERASEALAKIGTASVVEAIGREYLNEEIPFRIHATGALGNIKTEASENLMLELLQRRRT
ncbi:MAG: hypothetical protein M1379_18125 [Firmicutes bacterium]|nr:hypothetical protein [Bacillota bacterium]